MIGAPRVLVTGGTGKTGGHLVRRLAEHGLVPRVATRSGHAMNSKAEGILFDWYDERTFEAAIADVDCIYLVAPTLDAEPFSKMKNFIDLALQAGARRFVLLSASSLPEGGPAMGKVHQYLRLKAPEWVVLQPSWFMQNFSVGQHLPTIRDEGVIYSATEDGRIPFIDAEDIAEVAFHALIDESPFNSAFILTGPEAVSYDEVADLIGRARGRRVIHRRLTAEELARHWINIGMSPAFAEMLAAMDVSIAGGAEDRTTDWVSTLTGRSAKSLAAFAKDNADVWRSR